MKVRMLSLIWNDQTLISYTYYKNFSSPFYVYTWKDFYNKLETFLNEGKEPLVRSLTNKYHSFHPPKPYENHHIHVADWLGMKKLNERLWHRFGDKVIAIREDGEIKIKFNPKSAILLKQI